jgi:membrane protein YdbS with pleckstrin-like domain
MTIEDLGETPDDHDPDLRTEPHANESAPEMPIEPDRGLGLAVGDGPEAEPVETPPEQPPETFDRQMLSSSVRWVWFVGYLIPSLVLTLVVLQLDIFVFPTRAGLATSATLVVALAFSVWRTMARYRNWSWELDETELVIDRGVVFKLTRVVPRVRIQHVDLSSGPVDRIFNLRQLSIYTAGTREADASIPGLTAERAEALRQALITRRTSP